MKSVDENTRNLNGLYAQISLDALDVEKWAHAAFDSVEFLKNKVAEFMKSTQAEVRRSEEAREAKTAAASKMGKIAETRSVGNGDRISSEYTRRGKKRLATNKPRNTATEAPPLQQTVETEEHNEVAEVEEESHATKEKEQEGVA